MSWSLFQAGARPVDTDYKYLCHKPSCRNPQYHLLARRNASDAAWHISKSTFRAAMVVDRKGV